MRILWLGNSDDVNALVPEEKRMPSVPERFIEERTGHTPEILVRPLWPSSDMAERAGKWVDDFDPHMVCLYVGAYWYSHRSVPLRVQRKLKIVGGPVATAGRRAAESRAFGERRWFHFLRALALKTIGGDAEFTTQQVFERSEATVRRILAKEDRIVVVRAPTQSHDRKVRPGALSHLAMTRKLERMCQMLHVGFVGWDQPPFAIEKPDHMLGDELHIDEEGQARVGADIGEALAAGWLAVHPRALQREP